MTNLPYKVGDRYRCFIVVKPDRGWGGPYGQYRRPRIWRCDDCGFELPDHTDTFTGAKRIDGYTLARMADHHECGHAPCGFCGAMLLRRKDGTPRQHRADLCPDKSEGHRIEREFVKNMTVREFA